MEKFTRTFQNGNYDAEFDNLLGYDRGLILPARHHTIISPIIGGRGINWTRKNEAVAAKSH